MMISKNKIKYIRSLESKKNRDKQNLFVAEGPKVVSDIALRHPSLLRIIVATASWIRNNGAICSSNTECEVIEVNEEELQKTSFLCHPQQVIGVFEKLPSLSISNIPGDQLSLVLDGIQDPGNLGTIIRIADWFGIENIICSSETVDVYNPKVVQATMGSISRVEVGYLDLPKLFTSLPQDTPIYGTLLEGDNIYSQELENHGLIVMGNEGKGLSPDTRKRINHALRIPSFPLNRQTADSLNVAIATAIVCAEFRRRM